VSRQRSSIEWQDIVAATFVVGKDLVECDYLTHQEAIDNLPVSGGGVYTLPGTYSQAVTITMPDKDVTFEFASGVTMSIGSTVIALFTVPDGLTDRRTYCFYGLTATAGDVADQTFMELAETNAQGIVKFYNCTMTGWNVIFDVSASDLDYIFPVDMYLYGCRLEAAVGLGDNTIVKTVAAAGAFTSGVVLWAQDTMLNTEQASVAVWSSFNYGFDLISDGTVYALFQGPCKLDGLQGPLLLYGSGVFGMWALEIFGGNYWARSEWIGGALSYGALTISTSIYQFDNNLQQAGTIIVNAPYCKINVRYSDLGGSPPAVEVDLLSTAHRCVISGNFGDNTTAAVRVASVYNRFIGCLFESSGAHGTIVETGAADNNIGVGCAGLSSGGGMTIIGAGSVFDLTLANLP